MGIVLLWWLALEIVGLAALPLTALIFARLPGRGWIFAKPLGLIVLCWLIWFPLIVAHALPYSAAWIFGTFIAFALGNLALLRQLPSLWQGMLSVWREHRAYVVGGEVVFFAGFALMAWVRSFTPAVVDTEKFMDVAFISSLWRTPHLPAPDPWLSGNPINYYYFGHFMIASLAKLLGTQPGTAFNLGVALVFALCSVAIFGVVTSVVAVMRGSGPGSLQRAMPYGLFSLVAVLILGNLNGAQVWWRLVSQLLRNVPSLHGNVWTFWLHRDLWTQYDWWSPSRVVPDTINEFPAFSFVLADLHAHVLALPFAALAVALAFNLFMGRGKGLRVFGDGGERWLVVAVTAITIGGLYAINGWDLPTYLGLALVGLAAQQWLAHARRLSRAFALDLFTVAAILVALCFLLYLPFYRGFVSPSSGVKLVPASQRSAIGYEFAIFGLPLVIVASLLFLRLTRLMGELASGFTASRTAVLSTQTNGEGDMAFDAPQDTGAPIRTLLSAVVVAVPLAALLLVTLATTQVLSWTLFWFLLLTLVCLALTMRELLPSALNYQAAEEGADAAEGDHAANRGELWGYVLIGVAAALVAAAEVVYLRDIFDSRMNTVFKLYYQAWLLFGLAAGVALALLIPAARSALADFVSGRSSPVATSQAQSATAPSAQRLAVAATGLGGGERDRDVARRGPVTTADDLEPESPGVLAAGGRGRGQLPESLRWLKAGGILVWMVALVALIGAALVYPVLATSARTDNFTLPTGLDGTAYMASDPVHTAVGCSSVGAGSNHDDNEAIAWLNTHVSGSLVILEAPGCEWSHYSRVSAFTGLPTLLGWPGGHEGEWRVNWVTQTGQENIFAQRQDAIQTIYTSPGQQTVLGLLQQYHVKYVYVGAAERDLYPNANLDRFSAYLTTVYQRDGVTIYAAP